MDGWKTVSFPFGVLKCLFSGANWLLVLGRVTPPKFNIGPEKLPKPNRKVVFQPPFFRVYVKLQGCTPNPVLTVQSTLRYGGHITDPWDRRVTWPEIT